MRRLSEDEPAAAAAATAFVCYFCFLLFIALVLIVDCGVSKSLKCALLFNCRTVYVCHVFLGFQIQEQGSNQYYPDPGQNSKRFYGTLTIRP